MGKLAGFVGSTIGSSIGWWVGSLIGLTTAFMVSMVGFGIGLYFARRWASDYL